MDCGHFKREYPLKNISIHDKMIRSLVNNSASSSAQSQSAAINGLLATNGDLNGEFGL
jgi:hypothetical protein